MSRLAPLCLLLLSSLPASAGQFSVSPIPLNFASAIRIAAVTITNDDNRALVFKASSAAWAQDAAGEDVYVPTQDLIVTPPLFRLEPGTSRAVRVGTQQEPGDVERAYRVFLEEQPQVPSESTSTSVALVVKFGEPVFVAPRSERIAGIATVSKSEAGSFTLDVRNNGNVHFQVKAITVNGIEIGDIKTWYLLAGVARSYPITVPNDACGGVTTLDVRVKTSRNEFGASADAGQACHR